MNEQAETALMEVFDREKLDNMVDALEQVIRQLLAPRNERREIDSVDTVCLVYNINELRHMLQEVKNNIEKGGNRL